MNIFFLHLNKKLLFYFLITYLVILGIVWLTQSLRLLELIVHTGIDVVTFFNITSFLIIPMSHLCIPITLFFATGITFMSLEASNEFVILKTLGLNNRTIYIYLLPILITIALLHILISLYLLPHAYQRFKNMQHYVRENFINSIFEEGVFNTRSNLITVYIDRKITNYKYEGIFIYDFRDKDKPLTITAESGEFVFTNHGPGFILNKGSHQAYNKLNHTISLGFFDSYEFAFKIDVSERNVQFNEPNELYIYQLFSSKDKTQEIAKRHWIAAWQRLLWPFLNLILPIIIIATSGSFTNRRNVNIKYVASIGQGLLLMIFILLINNLALKNFYLLYICIGITCAYSSYMFLKLSKR